MEVDVVGVEATLNSFIVQVNDSLGPWELLTVLSKRNIFSKLLQKNTVKIENEMQKMLRNLSEGYFILH